MNPSFDPAILVTDGPTMHLISGLCPDCGAVAFPRRRHCPRCSAPTHEHPLPTVGVVRSYCRIALPLPGAEPPVTLVRVELSPQCTVQGVMDGAVDIGDRVALVPRQIDGTDNHTGFGFARCAS
ncbi:Zn-ribbon domain-containing OB-fold protein [Mycolicibacter sinensis]|jgi:uncharacterized OB-fold protein